MDKSRKRNHLITATSSKASDKLINHDKEQRKSATDVSDTKNIFLLLFLYVLQGIPIGLSASIPMILQNRNISYKEQATFSLAIWPFSVKLLWAPLVDSCYWPSMGRRKSWLVPAQYLIGLFLLGLSYWLDSLMGAEGDTSTRPNVVVLTTIFFALNFLAATQDIAVDGWALTMLSKEKVGYASTCNSVGQTAGFSIGFVVMLALESKDFCINYLGRDSSIVTLDGYFFFWGMVFLVTTSLVWALKTETEPSSGSEEEEEENMGFKDTYKTLLSILRKPNIQRCVLVLLTCKIGFAATDALTALKLTEAGVPKDQLAFLSVPLTPVQLLLPWLVSRYTTGPKPMDVYLQAFPCRWVGCLAGGWVGSLAGGWVGSLAGGVLMGLVFAAVIYVTPQFADEQGVYHTPYYVLIVFVFMLNQVALNCMFVAVMAFFSRISDPSVGGTYMTLLNTFTNLGGNWPVWVALRYVSDLTWTQCSYSHAPNATVTVVTACDSKELKEACSSSGGECVTTVDGYYVETVLCVTIGLLWFVLWGSKEIKRLQRLPATTWLVTSPGKKHDTSHRDKCRSNASSELTASPPASSASPPASPPASSASPPASSASPPASLASPPASLASPPASRASPPASPASPIASRASPPASSTSPPT
ncbi:Acetyl-coenzyme A transporter 1 [Trinorchestia longiramus]|nr:Acetyl-coenzyme A transporter 1 [Trinorchestia longiramus]